MFNSSINIIKSFRYNYMIRKVLENTDNKLLICKYVWYHHNS